MYTWIRTLAARVRSAWRVDDLDREFDDELQSHLALAEADKIRQGMNPADARREARVELGGLQQLREAGRAARGLPWLETLWLDIKLGARLLRKSWGLTLVGGVAMTVVIAIAAGAFGVVQVELGSTLPLEDGEDVVALTVRDPVTGTRHSPSRRDFERWRTALTSVEHVAAFSTVERNLDIGAGIAGDPVSIAEMTAAGFEVARIAPRLGRTLVASDERVGAAPVVVIGYDVWRSRFLSDPAAVGRQVRLDGISHTVVGVMPEGFAFPVHHGLWTPLLATPPSGALDERPAGFTFARLAEGATRGSAEAELTAVGLLPLETTTPIAERRPQVVPYTVALTVNNDEEEYAARLALWLVALLLLPPCANIGILVYARTVTRQTEFAARYALGASRGRLVGQLFIEVLVLAAGAAAAALILLVLFYRLEPFTGPNEPFWKDYGVSASTVLFAAGLAVFAALVAGMIPAVQATGRLALSGLSALGGRTSVKLGATWTALVVAQIALSVAVLPSAVEYGWSMLRPGVLGPGFEAEHYLTARLTMDAEVGAPGLDRLSTADTRIGARHAELVRRLADNRDVSAVSISAALPGAEPWAFVEVDRPEGAVPSDALPVERLSGLQVVFNRVDQQFFSAFDVPLLSGRQFVPSDFRSGQNALLVNRAMARDLAGAGSPLGRLIQYRSVASGPAPETEPWYEIVGVVENHPANADARRVYHPLAPGEQAQVALSVRARPTAEPPSDRVRETVAALDPGLRVDEVLPLDEVYRRVQLGRSVVTVGLGGVILSVLLLSAAGLYALMSFTVNRRRREIGIRSALGAQPRRLLSGIFRRALGQVGVGAAVGILAAVPLNRFLSMAVEDLRHANIPGVCTLSNQFGPLSLFRKRDFLPVHRPARCA